MGGGGKVILALQSPEGIIMVYTGIAIGVDLTINHNHTEFRAEDSYIPHMVDTGYRTLTVQLEMSLDYMGGQMRTWADIHKPEEIEGRRQIDGSTEPRRLS